MSKLYEVLGLSTGVILSGQSFDEKKQPIIQILYTELIMNLDLIT